MVVVVASHHVLLSSQGLVCTLKGCDLVWFLHCCVFYVVMLAACLALFFFRGCFGQAKGCTNQDFNIEVVMDFFYQNNYCNSFIFLLLQMVLAQWSTPVVMFTMGSGT